MGDPSRLEAAEARISPPAAADAAAGAEEAGIGSDERAEVLQQIEDLTRRRARGPGASEPAARRSGALLPVMVDLAALLVLAAGTLLLLAVFDRRQETIVSDTARVLSTEARVVRAVREEARDRLAAKDREIGDIEARLGEVSRERERILADLEARVSRRAKELEAEMGAELEALRGELRRTGAAERDIEAELAALTAKKQRELDTVLATFREEARRQVEERERAAAELNVRLSATLEAARAERQALEAAYGRRTRELESERDAAAQRLRAAEESAERERLVRGQILASYDGVRRELEAGRSGEALKRLDALTSYLGTGLVAALPSFERERSVQLYLVDALRELVNRRVADSSAAAIAQAEAALLLGSVADLYGRAEALRAQGDLDGAATLYLAAVQRVPQVARSQAWLEARRIAGEREALASEERRRAARSAFLDTLGSPTPATAGGATELDEEELLSLLEYKLRVMELLVSEGVRERDPDLAAGLDRYLEALGRSKLAEGREAGVAEGRAQVTAELAGVLRALRGAGGGSDAAPAGQGGGLALAPELLDELRGLLAPAAE